MTNQSNTFKCPNCDSTNGILVMTGNNKPATECQYCGHLVINVSNLDISVGMQIAPASMKAIQDQKYREYIEYERKRLLQAREDQYFDTFFKDPTPNPPAPKRTYRFSPGEIVTCIETYHGTLFKGYNYMVNTHNVDAGLVTVLNLRTMQVVPSSFSDTRFQSAPQIEVDRLVELGRRRGWKWTEILDKEVKKNFVAAMSKEVKKINAEAKAWVKPKAKALTMADKLYWLNYNKAFKSKNPGPAPKAPKAERKFKFTPTNPFNIKPWGK